MQNPHKATTTSYIKLILTAFLWGGTFIAGKVVVRNVGPASAAFLRFALAFTILLTLTLRIEKKLPKINFKQFAFIFLLGFSGVFTYNIFFFKGLKIIAAGRAALIIALNPICICLLSAIFFRERLTLLKITGILISVCGAMVVISRGDFSGIFAGGLGLGELYILICVLSWGSYSVIGKVVMKELSPLVAVTWSTLIGTLLLLLPAFSEGLGSNILSFSGRDWAALFYLGFFGTVLGFVWYYEAIRVIGATRAGLFINFVPISAIILAFFFLGEPITMSLFSGALLVSSGVYLTNLPGKDPNPAVLRK